MNPSGAVTAVESPGPSGLATVAREPASVRIGELDALRGIAALAVVFHHLTSRFYEDFGTPPGAVPAFPIPGVQGVFLFFIISGFVISQTLDRTRRGREFLVSRFSRIFPSFWVCVLLTFGLVRLFGLPGRKVGVGAALVNLTMLQDHVHVAQVDYVYWSLTMELTFYAIAFAAHSRGWLARHPHGFAWGWLAFSAACVVASRGFGFNLHENIKLLTLPNYAPLFVAGILFHLLRFGRGTPETHVLLACCLALHNAANWGGKTGLVLSGGMFACFYLVAYRKLAFLGVRPLLFLGAISYPLYLLHNNIGMVFLRLQLAAGVGFVVALAVALVAIIVLSAAVTRFVEKPAMRWIRDRMKSARGGAVAV